MKKIIHNPLLKIIILLILSVILPFTIDLGCNDIITYDFALTTNIALFSLSLAITTIFFTVLDRYQQLLGDKNPKVNILIDTSLKEMGDNTLALLFISFATFLFSLFQTIFEKIDKINLNVTIIIFLFLLMFLTIYDVTKATVTLIKGISIIRN